MPKKKKKERKKEKSNFENTHASKVNTTVHDQVLGSSKRGLGDGGGRMRKHCAWRQKFPFWQGCCREVLLYLMKCDRIYLFLSSVGEHVL